MLVSLSANHRTTPFELLERLASVSDELGQSLAAAHDSIRGVVVVATCNRFEAYLDLRDEEWVAPDAALTAVLDDIARRAELPYRQLRDAVDFVHGNAVARHLFAVSAGLESVVVGEDEIAGQVRRALETSRANQTSTASLERLFQRATETSRQIKNTARVSEAGRSLVKLALELASSQVNDWASTRVLLIGTGRYAAASLAALRALGVSDVRVYSVSHRGAAFAHSHELPLVSADQFRTELALADVVVACTATEGFAVRPDDLRVGRASIGAAPRRQLVIDLGLPRNVDPELAGFEHVELLDLETIRLHSPIDELATLDAARSIVVAASHRYATAERSGDITPAVVALRSWMHAQVDEELARYDARAPETREVASAAVRHFSSVLLHRLMSQGQGEATVGNAAAWTEAVGLILGAELDASASESASESASASGPTRRIRPAAANGDA